MTRKKDRSRKLMKDIFKYNKKEIHKEMFKNCLELAKHAREPLVHTYKALPLPRHP